MGAVLKIFNGIHKGGSIDIDASTLTIASQEPCDVHVLDESFRDRQATFALSEHSLSMLLNHRADNDLFCSVVHNGARDYYFSLSGLLFGVIQSEAPLERQGVESLLISEADNNYIRFVDEFDQLLTPFNPEQVEGEGEAESDGEGEGEGEGDGEAEGAGEESSGESGDGVSGDGSEAAAAEGSEGSADHEEGDADVEGGYKAADPLDSLTAKGSSPFSRFLNRLLPASVMRSLSRLPRFSSTTKVTFSTIFVMSISLFFYSYIQNTFATSQAVGSSKPLFNAPVVIGADTPKPLPFNPAFESCQSQLSVLLERFPSVSLDLKGQTVVVQGWVNSSKELTDLQSTLQSQACPYVSEVSNDSFITDVLNEVLASHNEDEVKLRFGKAEGVVVATGFVKNYKIWEQISKKIIRDFRNISAVDDQTNSLRKIMNKINEDIIYHGLDGFIIMSGDKRNLHVNMVGSDDMRTAWREIKEDHAYELGFVQVKENFINLNQLGIVGINCCENPYLIMADGHRYMQGAYLKNGTKIVSIDTDNVVIMSNNMELKLPIGWNKK